MPIILGISGSLRQAAFSTTILRTLGKAIGDKATFRLATLNDIPPYDQDADTDTPPASVAALRHMIGAADGIIIASPEYNHGMSGVLKNALDWASRPYGHATLTGKPVFVLTSSPGAVGGARAHAQLNETLASIGARVLLRPQDGRLTDAPTLEFLMSGIDHLLADVAQPATADREEA